MFPLESLGESIDIAIFSRNIFNHVLTGQCLTTTLIVKMFMILCRIIPYNGAIKCSTYIVKYRHCKGFICLCGTFPVVRGGNGLL